jgi:hypothetical protein
LLPTRDQFDAQGFSAAGNARDDGVNAIRRRSRHEADDIMRGGMGRVRLSHQMKLAKELEADKGMEKGKFSVSSVQRETKICAVRTIGNFL